MCHLLAADASRQGRRWASARRVEYRLMLPPRAWPAGRGMSTTPRNGKLFLRGPLRQTQAPVGEIAKHRSPVASTREVSADALEDRSEQTSDIAPHPSERSRLPAPLPRRGRRCGSRASARDRRDRASSTTCGSNGSRCRAWKRRLQQQLSERHGLSVTVAHYPPGASKWNPIDHRLFSEISKNWAGRPLDSDETTLNFIGTTNTTSRLAFLRAWPHHANGVGVDRPIGAYQCQVVFDCLADQHPVERVAVRVWELGEMGDRRLAERQ